MNDFIEIENLTKEYANGAEKILALNNINLSIALGDYLAITGPSGAGKSTLLHILGSIDNPSSGKVKIGGIDIFKLPANKLCNWRNKTVGFVFQFYHLIEELSVLENICLPAYLANKRRKTVLKEAKNLLEYLKIEEKINYSPSQLSGGEKQRVAIARALINDPDILLCDEPTGNLDAASAETVLFLLEKLWAEKNKTIIIVTHNLTLAKRAKQMIYLKSGRIFNNFNLP